MTDRPKDQQQKQNEDGGSTASAMLRELGSGVELAKSTAAGFDPARQHDESNLGFLTIASKTAVRAGIQDPLVAVVQLLNHSSGLSIAEPKFMGEHKPAAFGSKAWLAETIGAGFGMVAPFVATERLTAQGLKGASKAALGISERLPMAKGLLQPMARTAHILSGDLALAERLTPRARLLGAVGKSTLDGAVFGFVLTPSQNDPSKGFWEQRFISAASGGLTFGTQSFVSHSLMAKWKSMGLPLENPVFQSSLRGIGTRMGTNALGGSVAGAVSAESHSLLSGKGHATTEEILQSMASFTVTGVGLDVFHIARESGQRKHQADPKTEAQSRESFVANLDKHLNRLEPAKAAEHAQQLQLLAEQVGRRVNEGASPGELARVYDSVNKLLAAERLVVDLTPEQRIGLARQLLFEAANPTAIDQGPGKTCGPTAIQEMALHTDPGKHIAAITQLLVSGKVATELGMVDLTPATLTKLPPEYQAMLKPDAQASRSLEQAARGEAPTIDGQRSYASQLSHLLIGNIRYQLLAPKGEHAIFAEGPKDHTRAEDTGERVFNFDKTSRTYKPVLERDGSPRAFLGIESRDIQPLYDALTGRVSGRDNFVLLNTEEPLTSRQGTRFRSPEQLDQLLRSGNRPFVVEVDPNHRLFGGSQTAARDQQSPAAGRHVVLVEPATAADGTRLTRDGKQLYNVIDNYGRSNDLVGSRAVTAHELFAATKPTYIEGSMVAGRNDPGQTAYKARLEAQTAATGLKDVVQHRQRSGPVDQGLVDQLQRVDDLVNRRHGPVGPVTANLMKQLHSQAASLSNVQLRDMLRLVADRIEIQESKNAWHGSGTTIERILTDYLTAPLPPGHLSVRDWITAMYKRADNTSRVRNTAEMADSGMRSGNAIEAFRQLQSGDQQRLISFSKDMAAAASTSGPVGAGEIAQLLVSHPKRAELIPGGKIAEAVKRGQLSADAWMALAQRSERTISDLVAKVDPQNYHLYSGLSDHSLSWVLTNSKDSLPHIERILAEPNGSMLLEVLSTSYTQKGGVPPEIAGVVADALQKGIIGVEAFTELHRSVNKKNVAAVTKEVLGEQVRRANAGEPTLPRDVLESIIWHSTQADHLSSLHRILADKAADPNLRDTVARLMTVDAERQQEYFLLMAQQANLDLAGSRTGHVLSYDSMRVLLEQGTSASTLRTYREAIDSNLLSYECFEGAMQAKPEQRAILEEVVLPGLTAEKPYLNETTVEELAFEALTGDPRTARRQAIAATRLDPEAFASYKQLAPEVQHRLADLIDCGAVTPEYMSRWLRSDKKPTGAALEQYALRVQELQDSGIDVFRVGREAEEMVANKKFDVEYAFDIVAIKALTEKNVEQSIDLYLESAARDEHAFEQNRLRDGLLYHHLTASNSADLPALQARATELNLALQGHSRARVDSHTALIMARLDGHTDPNTMGPLGLRRLQERANRIRQIYEHMPGASFDLVARAGDLADRVLPPGSAANKANLASVLEHGRINTSKVAEALGDPALKQELSQPELADALRATLLRRWAEHIEQLVLTGRPKNERAQEAFALLQKLAEDPNQQRAQRMLNELASHGKDGPGSIRSELQVKPFISAIVEPLSENRLKPLPADQQINIVVAVKNMINKSELAPAEKARIEAQLKDSLSDKAVFELPDSELDWFNRLSREELRQKAMEMARDNPAEMPQVFRGANRMIEGLNGQMISERLARDVLSRLTLSERQRAIEHMRERAPYMSVKGLTEIFDGIKHDVTTPGLNGRYSLLRPRGRGEMQPSINVLLVGESSPGHQLAYHFYKATDIDVSGMYRLQVVGEHLLIMDKSGNKRAITQRGDGQLVTQAVEHKTDGTIKLSGKEQPLDQRFVMFDSPALTGAPEAARPQLRQLIEKMQQQDKLYIPEQLVGSIPGADGVQRVPGFTGGINFMDLAFAERGKGTGSGQRFFDRIADAIGAERTNDPNRLRPTHDDVSALQRAMSTAAHARTEARLLDQLLRRANSKTGPGWSEVRELASVYGNAVNYRQVYELFDASGKLHEKMMERYRHDHESVTPEDFIFVVYEKEGSAWFLHQVHQMRNGFKPEQFRSEHELRRMAENGELKGKIVIHMDDAFDFGKDSVDKLRIMEDIKARAVRRGPEFGLKDTGIATLYAFDHDLASASAQGIRETFREVVDPDRHYINVFEARNLPDMVRRAQDNGFVPRDVDPNKYAVSQWSADSKNGEQKNSEPRTAAGEIWPHLIPNDTEAALIRFIKATGLAGARAGKIPNLYLPLVHSFAEYYGTPGWKDMSPSQRGLLLAEKMRSVLDAAESKEIKLESQQIANARKFISALESAATSSAPESQRALQDMLDYAHSTFSSAAGRESALSQLKQDLIKNKSVTFAWLTEHFSLDAIDIGRSFDRRHPVEELRLQSGDAAVVKDMMAYYVFRQPVKIQTQNGVIEIHAMRRTKEKPGAASEPIRLVGKNERGEPLDGARSTEIYESLKEDLAGWQMKKYLSGSKSKGSEVALVAAYLDKLSQVTPEPVMILPQSTPYVPRPFDSRPVTALTSGEHVVKSGNYEVSGTASVTADGPNVHVKATGEGVHLTSVTARNGAFVEAEGQMMVYAEQGSTVVARGRARVCAQADAHVVLSENAEVMMARQNAIIEASGSAVVNAAGNVQVTARDQAQVSARGDARVVASGDAQVKVADKAHVEASDRVSIILQDNATATITDGATAEAWNTSTVRAGGRSQVVANDHSTVLLSGDAHADVTPFARVEKRDNSTATVGGNAKVIVPTLSFEPTPRSAYEPSDPIVRVYRAQSDRVVKVEVYEATGQGQRRAVALGSGFVVKEGGYIGTAYHVVEGATGGVKIKMRDGRTYDAKIVEVDPSQDTALLRVTDPKAELPPGNPTLAELFSADGVDMVALGFAGGGSALTASPGKTQGEKALREFPDGVRNTAPDVDQLKIDLKARTDPGNSGGPVFRLYDGALVGIVTHGGALSQRTLFSRIDRLRQMLASPKID